MVGVYVQFSRKKRRYMRMGTYPTRQEAEESEYAEIPGARFVEALTEKLKPILEEPDFIPLNWWTRL